MIKRLLSLILIFAILTLALTSCKDDEGDTTGNNPPASDGDGSNNEDGGNGNGTGDGGNTLPTPPPTTELPTDEFD